MGQPASQQHTGDVPTSLTPRPVSSISSHRKSQDKSTVLCSLGKQNSGGMFRRSNTQEFNSVYGCGLRRSRSAYNVSVSS